MRGSIRRRRSTSDFQSQARRSDAISAARPSGVGPRELPPPPGHTAPDEATRLILERFAPAGVVVDQNLRILQFRGQTGLFLEPAPGEASAEPSEDGARRAHLRRCGRHPRGAAGRDTPVRRERRPQSVTTRAGITSTWRCCRSTASSAATSPGAVRTGRSQGRYSLLANERWDAIVRTCRSKNADERMSDLTRELAASREYLQSIIQELEAANEELQSANEEILSSNEELQSTNEELDTAKEELQCTNEELNTVNEELHARNEELSRVNSDLVNLLASVQIADRHRRRATCGSAGSRRWRRRCST